MSSVRYCVPQLYTAVSTYSEPWPIITGVLGPAGLGFV